MFELPYRYLFFIVVTSFLVACQNTSNKKNTTVDVENTQNQIKFGSTWDSVNYPFVIELRGSKVFEYNKNPSGQVCFLQKEINNIRIVQGDPKTDNSITIEYVDDTGTTISVNMNRQEPSALDSVKLDSICGAKPIWNGVWKKTGSSSLPDYYWLIKEPKTTAYFLDPANRCYKEMDLMKWRATAIAIVAVTIIDVLYDHNGVSTFASLERTKLSASDITPLCVTNP